ncbi:hypothetical protein, partial [Streptomyces sp. NPDC058664]
VYGRLHAPVVEAEFHAWLAGLGPNSFQADGSLNLRQALADSFAETELRGDSAPQPMRVLHGLLTAGAQPGGHLPIGAIPYPNTPRDLAEAVAQRDGYAALVHRKAAELREWIATADLAPGRIVDAVERLTGRLRDPAQRLILAELHGLAERYAAAEALVARLAQPSPPVPPLPPIAPPRYDDPAVRRAVIDRLVDEIAEARVALDDALADANPDDLADHQRRVNALTRDLVRAAEDDALRNHGADPLTGRIGTSDTPPGLLVVSWFAGDANQVITAAVRAADADVIAALDDPSARVREVRMRFGADGRPEVVGVFDLPSDGSLLSADRVDDDAPRPEPHRPRPADRTPTLGQRITAAEALQAHFLDLAVRLAAEAGVD